MLKPHEQRVVDEKQQLDEKLHKLKIFIDRPMFDTLDDIDQELLLEQRNIMMEYSGW